MLSDSLAGRYAVWSLGRQRRLARRGSVAGPHQTHHHRGREQGRSTASRGGGGGGDGSWLSEARQGPSDGGGASDVGGIGEVGGDTEVFSRLWSQQEKFVEKVRASGYIDFTTTTQGGLRSTSEGQISTILLDSSQGLYGRQP